MMVYLFLLAILHPAVDTYEEETYSFSGFMHDQRLSGENIRSLFQDSKGFMWFGVDSEGLCRYDASELEIFSHQSSDTTSLSSNFIHDIEEGPDGNLWVATDKGLDVFLRKSRTFKKCGLPAGTKECHVLRKDKEGKMWVGTGNGVYVFEGTGTYNRVGRYLENRTVKRILFSENGELYFGASCGLYQVRSDGHILSHWSKKTDSLLYDDEVNALLEVSADYLLLGTDNGVNLFHREKNRFYRLEFRESGVFQHGKVGIVDLFKDSKGVIWIGTSSYGIMSGPVSTSGGDSIPVLIRLPGRVEGVTSKNITAFLEDKSSQLWVATKFGGLSIYDRRRQIFPRYTLPSYESTDHSYNHILSAIEDHEGNFWLGTRKRGLWKMDIRTNKYSEVIIYQGPEEVRRIDVIYEDRSGNIWIGHKKGVNIITPGAGNRYYKHIPKVYSINEDRSGRIWFGTTGGIYCTLSSMGDIGRFPSEHVFFRDSTYTVDQIYCDQQSRIWFGTNSSGLFCYSSETKELSHFVHQDEQGNSISGNTIRSIFEDSKGRIWIGTKSSGLNLYENGRFHHLSKDDGLPSNTIFSMIEDNRGLLWVISNNGVTRFDPKMKQSIIFNQNHGLQGNVFEKKACFKSRNGNIFIAGNNGFNFFDPIKISLDDFRPPIIITAIKVMGNTLYRDVIETNSFSLDYQSNIVSFEFSALDYRDVNSIRYAYKLEGVDDSWGRSKRQNVITYSNLSPGEYTFYVKATNADGVWAEAPLAVPFTIEKPFWKMWWAYLVYIGLGILVIYIVYYIVNVRTQYYHQLRSAELELQRTQELNQLKLNFFTNISHELRTPLTLIVASVDKMMQHPKEDIKSAIKSAYRSTRQLLRLTDQLLYFRKIENGNLPLKVSNGNLKQHLTDLVQSFNELALRESINLHLSVDDLKQDAWYDSDKVEKIMCNLLLNAFKYTRSNGSVSVTISHDDSDIVNTEAYISNSEYVRVRISDTGVGLTPNQIAHVFDRYYQSDISNTGGGIGLDLVKGLVTLHKGKITVSSQEGKGSTFIFWIPVSRAAYDSMEVAESSGDFGAETPLMVDKFLNFESPSQLLPQRNSGGSKYKLLIVEDNEELTCYLKELLSIHFFTLSCNNGQTALDLARTHHPDIILSDVMMPGMDGLQFCKKLRQDIRISHIPVVLLTARVLQEQQIEGFESGADAYVVKPFQADVLPARLKAIIKNRKITSRPGSRHDQASFSTIDQHLMQKVDDIIHENYHNPDFSVEEFAYDLHLSRSQLFRKLKALVGKTPSEYLYTYRIERAIMLLNLGEFTVAEVAYKTGFRSPNSFSKTFAKHVGVSPSKYVHQADIPLK